MDRKRDIVKMPMNGGTQDFPVGLWRSRSKALCKLQTFPARLGLRPCSGDLKETMGCPKARLK